MVILMTGCGLHEMTNAKKNVPMIPALDEKDALTLREEANARYYSVFHDGGEECKDLTDERLANDEYYYYFCHDLDSLDKIKESLQTVFSKEVASELINSYPTEEINDKLAYLPYDAGSMLNWDEAKGTLSDDQTGMKKYEFIVPDLDGVTESIEIEFVYVENRGWRINTEPLKIL